jgi:pimeloyl-ACP methyl ester carboxylesterase
MPDERTPIVFIHGLWFHATSWGPWVEFFRDAGYEPVAPGWPGEPETVEQARARPEAVADTSIDDAVAHYTKIIESLPANPIIVGHSFGGLVAEKLLGQGIGVAAVAIDPAQIKGVLALPLAQLRSALPALKNPANLRKSVSLTREEWRYGIGNAVSEQESDELYDAWSIPAPARPVFQVSAANFALHSEAKIDTDNTERGPLLLIGGALDHTVPEVSVKSSFKQYDAVGPVTEFREFEGRGHSLTVDRGWPEVAGAALRWLREQGL